MTVSEQFKREVIGRRVEVLQAMDYAIRYMNDEDSIEPWFHRKELRKRRFLKKVWRGG